MFSIIIETLKKMLFNFSVKITNYYFFIVILLLKRVFSLNDMTCCFLLMNPPCMW